MRAASALDRATLVVECNSTPGGPLLLPQAVVQRQAHWPQLRGRASEPRSDLHPTRVSETFDRLVKHSGLPRIRLHDLRHGHATLALAAGVHPKVVQERLGHSSVAFTLDRYSHVVPAMQEDAAATVARLVGLD